MRFIHEIFNFKVSYEKLCRSQTLDAEKHKIASVNKATYGKYIFFVLIITMFNVVIHFKRIT